MDAVALPFRGTTRSMIQQQPVAPRFLWLAGPLLTFTLLFTHDTWGVEAVALYLVRTALFAVIAFDFWRYPNPERNARTNAVLTGIMVTMAVAATVLGSLSLYHLWRAAQIDQRLGG
ncbi:hypothetical protein IHN63_06255 [Deinococcus sp. 6YEL10]|uniref:hypothetical protein n=1 Tax=Deinococcus sp. 6YEL10 TaxID=2745870 RepID=UPI001E5992E2|nr:hypothetical protein [Deinococcus sp. 6YEL10]MCD0160912.1 hypothetical protein [Deinococcus sp. 6YEL10]